MGELGVAVIAFVGLWGTVGLVGAFMAAMHAYLRLMNN